MSVTEFMTEFERAEFERGQKNVKDVYKSFTQTCKATKEECEELLNKNIDSAIEAISHNTVNDCTDNEFFLGVIYQCKEYLKKL